jgi:hypothetical protein
MNLNEAKHQTPNVKRQTSNAKRQRFPKFRYFAISHSQKKTTFIGIFIVKVTIIRASGHLLGGRDNVVVVVDNVVEVLAVHEFNGSDDTPRQFLIDAQVFTGNLRVFEILGKGVHLPLRDRIFSTVEKAVPAEDGW